MTPFYQDQELVKIEVDALNKLEELIGKPIFYRELDYETLLKFGYHSFEGHVKHLNLEKCGLMNVPQVINDFHQMTHLNLNDNLITTIDDFTNLSELIDLQIGKSYRGNGNYITKIKGLEKLTNLTTLYLDGNYIKEIEGLDSLQKLEKLNLSDNYITEMKNLENLPNLEMVWLKGNYIPSLEVINIQNSLNPRILLE
ncbi:MAG: leucine-rich repeat domain-containing protein [Promethearchaeota archaeon]